MVVVFCVGGHSGLRERRLGVASATGYECVEGVKVVVFLCYRGFERHSSVFNDLFS